MWNLIVSVPDHCLFIYSAKLYYVKLVNMYKLILRCPGVKKVQLPVLLCAAKTVEGNFRFCWTISPNVGQTHKENPNLEFFICYVH